MIKFLKKFFRHQKVTKEPETLEETFKKFLERPAPDDFLISNHHIHSIDYYNYFRFWGEQIDKD